MSLRSILQAANRINSNSMLYLAGQSKSTDIRDKFHDDMTQKAKIQNMVKNLQGMFQEAYAGARAMGGMESTEWFPEIDRYVVVNVDHDHEDEYGDPLQDKSKELLGVSVDIFTKSEFKALEEALRSNNFSSMPRGHSVYEHQTLWQNADKFKFPAEEIALDLLDLKDEQIKSDPYDDPRYLPKRDDLDDEVVPGPEDPRWNQPAQSYQGITPELEEERARKQQHALDLLSRPAPKRYASFFRVARKFLNKYCV